VADRDERELDRGPRPQLVGALILALAVVVFIVQNRDDVTIHFLFWDKKTTVWPALLVTSVVAIVAAELFSHVLRRQRRRH